MKCLIVFTMVLALVAATKEDSRSPRDQKLGIFTPGNIGTLIGTLGILKLKALFVSLLVFGVFGLFSKLLGDCGQGGSCIPDFITPTGHSSVDYGGQYGYYRSAKSDDLEYSKILQEVTDSLDMVNISFKTFGVETDSCKKKFVCLADNEALENPLLGFAFNIFGKSFSKYRDETESKEPKDCVKLFKDCPRGILPENENRAKEGRVLRRTRPQQYKTS